MESRSRDGRVVVAIVICFLCFIKKMKFMAPYQSCCWAVAVSVVLGKVVMENSVPAGSAEISSSLALSPAGSWSSESWSYYEL